MFKPLRQHNFKYTVSRDRVEWCKGVYNTLGEIVKIIPKINFNSYSFSGMCDVDMFEVDSEVDSEFDLEVNSKVHSNTHEYIQLMLKCDHNRMDYCIVGGTAYEILNAEYPKVNIRKYMDPTGDMDITVYVPPLNIIGDYNREKEYILYSKDGSINAYYKHMMHWLYDEFSNVLQQEHINLTNGFSEFELNEYPERHIPNEHKTEAMGFRSSQIGNCMLVCFMDRIDAKMLKIQLIGKINNTIDHLVEFIFNLGDNATFIKYSGNSQLGKPMYMTYSNIHIQDFSELIDDNVLAYLTRYVYPEAIYNAKKIRYKHFEFIHKSTNHVGRLMYILELMSVLPKKQQLQLKQYIELSFGSMNKNKFLEAFHYKKIIELYENAFFYYYEVIPKSRNYSINKIKIVDLLGQYNYLFDTPIKFMGKDTPYVPHNTLINENAYQTNIKYYTRKHKNIASPKITHSAPQKQARSTSPKITRSAPQKITRKTFYKQIHENQYKTLFA